MSIADLYRELYAQEPPDGAVFGVDVSWYQAASNGRLNERVAQGWWDWIVGQGDVAWVTIRLTFGASGQDGADDVHLQCADRAGYKGALGAYHYLVPGSGAGQADNFLAAYNRNAGRWSHEMLDHEEGASWTMVDDCMSRIEAATGRECIYYTGRGIGNQAGWPTINRPLWAAHYGNGYYAAWTPCTSFSHWHAPYCPDAWGEGNRDRLIWQFGSSSSAGSLDLNVTTSPGLLGIGTPVPAPAPGPIVTEDDMPLEAVQDPTGTVYLRDGLRYTPVESEEMLHVYQAKGWVSKTITPINAWDLQDFILETPEKEAQLRDAVTALLGRVPADGGPVDVSKLVDQLAKALPAEIGKQVADELARRMAS